MAEKIYNDTVCDTGRGTFCLAREGAEAARAILSLPPSVKNDALRRMAFRLQENASVIFESNRADLEAAKSANLPYPVLKRLAYDESKLQESVKILSALEHLPEPAGKVLESRVLDEGLVLRKVSCPIGLIALIFESRPDALVQMAGLAAKSGNAIILKGGREAEKTNRVLSDILQLAGIEAGLPPGWISSVATREEAGELLELDAYVDLVIPRGSKEFVRRIQETSRVPVLGHADGVCHVYVHEDADVEMAVRVAVDSKTQYPAACNAAETLLVHRDIAGKALPVLAAALEEKSVRLDLCPRSFSILGPGTGRSAKADGNWSVEYLDLQMSVCVVDSLEDAIRHINRYGSGHTDAIVASSRDSARSFLNGVDSSSVYWNASTRFADGYRYGLGAEVGISTGKLHARGPMGLEGLMTYKWKLEGRGQVVAEYASGERSFLHKDLQKEAGTNYEEG